MDKEWKLKQQGETIEREKRREITERDGDRERKTDIERDRAREIGN